MKISFLVNTFEHIELEQYYFSMKKGRTSQILTSCVAKGRGIRIFFFEYFHFTLIEIGRYKLENVIYI